MCDVRRCRIFDDYLRPVFSDVHSKFAKDTSPSIFAKATLCAEVYGRYPIRLTVIGEGFGDWTYGT